MLPKRRRPTHPGKILHEEFLKPLLLTPRQFAEKLGGNWSELQIEAIIQGKDNLSEKAIREFAEFLETPAEFWKHLQDLYNQWDYIEHQNEKGAPKPWKKAQ
jgi:addiction module HigA family antidote